jgi:hypothetical protein
MSAEMIKGQDYFSPSFYTELYSMGLSKFQQMAHEAKATYKVDKLVLVSIENFPFKKFTLSIISIV